MLNTASLLYFSPTGSTEKIAKILGQKLANTVNLYDLSETNIKEHTFQADELLVVATPVFAGRIPQIALENLKKFKSKQNPTVSIVVYGNRAFDDALLELNNNLEDNNFKIIASAALIAQHSIVSNIAQNRPDSQDIDFINNFRQNILDKITNLSFNKIEVPGHKPYKALSPNSVTPITLDTCTECKICSDNCPTLAISEENASIIEKEKCIRCMRCIKNCPITAKELPKEFYEKIKNLLNQSSLKRKENKIFI